MATKDELLLDKRIRERNIRRGELTFDRLEKHLGALSDAEVNAEYIPIHEEPEEEAPEGEEAAEGAEPTAAPEA